MATNISGTILTPDEIRKMTDQIENAKAQEALAKQKALEEQQEELRREFMEREIRPDALRRVNNAIRHAIEAGHTEVMLFKFPSAFCTDKGRAINNFDPAWSGTLTGFARKAYEAYEAELEPIGYRMRAQILDYPDGNLGDVGLFLSW